MVLRFCRLFKFLHYLISKVDETGAKGRELDEIYEMMDWMSPLGPKSVWLRFVEVNLSLCRAPGAGLESSHWAGRSGRGRQAVR